MYIGKETSILQLFPLESRERFMEVALQQSNVTEIRLRADLPIIIMKGSKEFFLDKKGHMKETLSDAYYMNSEELEDILNHICQYSLYAYEDEIKQGFITVAGGHRIGIAGQVVMEGEEKIRTIKHILHLNIRIAHQIIGAADSILPSLYRDGRIQNILIISPPGCGKTTLLRDIIRQVSNGNLYGKGCAVGVVDERSEIGGCYMGMQQNDLGIRTDVLDACPKAFGMMMLLRSMSPSVVAIDEIGSKKDMEAVHIASSCGVKIVATVHGTGIADVRLKEGMEELWKERIFDIFLVLGRVKDKCIIQQQYGSEIYE